MASIGVLPNKKTTAIVTGGGVIGVTYPVIALAFGWCNVNLNGGSGLAGRRVRFAVNSYAVEATLDADGKADVSLRPFMRAAMNDVGALDDPLETNSLSEAVYNKMRGVFNLDITDVVSETEVTVAIYYIYGNNVLEYNTHRYINYNTGDILGTWTTLDYFADNAADGTPDDPDAFAECNFNLNIHLDNPGSVVPLEVSVYRGEDIVNTVISYHLIEDCRTRGVRAVRWLDSRGGINVRKLTLTTEAHGADVGDSYERPHLTRNVVAANDYSHGDDRWAAMAAATTVTLGDDAIPAELYEWLRELVTSPCVDMWSGEVDGAGKWLRCNVAESGIERDTRKGVFSLTLKLAVPTYQVQDF